MAKKRTKKQKQSAKHSFTFSWDPSITEPKSKTTVKGQFKNEPKINFSKLHSDKFPINTAQLDESVRTKKGIIKSLILATLILGTQLVLYFFWN